MSYRCGAIGVHMYRLRRAEAAQRAAAHIASHFGITKIDAAIELGTGWGESLFLNRERSLSFKEIPGFEQLGELAGHERLLAVGQFDGRTVALLRGRVHVNEMPGLDPSVIAMVNLQVEMLFQLGITQLILTCAAGSLRDSIAPGHIVLVKEFFGLHFPNTLGGGEFVSVEDSLNDAWIARLRELHPTAHVGSHAVVLGPTFESPEEKRYLRRVTSCKTVGMSMLPEARAAQSHNKFAKAQHIDVLAIAGISNTATEAHDHDTNVARMKAHSEFLGKLLMDALRTAP